MCFYFARTVLQIFVESDEMCDLTKDDMFYEFAERLVDRANKNGAATMSLS